MSHSDCSLPPKQRSSFSSSVNSSSSLTAVIHLAPLLVFTDPFEPVQLTNPAENKCHKKTKKIPAGLMTFNWFIEESNYIRAAVEGVGLCSWERGEGRRKGRRESTSN